MQQTAFGAFRGHGPVQVCRSRSLWTENIQFLETSRLYELRLKRGAQVQIGEAESKIKGTDYNHLVLPTPWHASCVEFGVELTVRLV